MDLDAAKAKLVELRESLVAAIDFFKELGLDPVRLETTVSLIEKLEGHLQVLDGSHSIGTLQKELRLTNVTLDLLRENLQSYESPPEKLLQDVDEAQDEVQKNIVKIKKLKRAGLNLAVAGVAAVGIYLVAKR